MPAIDVVVIGTFLLCLTSAFIKSLLYVGKTPQSSNELCLGA